MITRNFLNELNPGDILKIKFLSISNLEIIIKIIKNDNVGHCTIRCLSKENYITWDNDNFYKIEKIA